MQIIEVTALAVRAAVTRLTRSTSPLTFTLFPMVHVGTPEYYAEITERIGRCQLAVVEGVGRSTPTSLLTLPAMALAHSQRTGLVEQNLAVEKLGMPVICPDMAGPEFDRRWQRLPLFERAVAWIGAPIQSAYQMMFATRRQLAESLALDDLPPDWLEDATTSLPELLSLIGDQRDRLLIEAVAHLHAQRCHEPISVAIVYGAAHIGPVAHALQKLFGYVARDGEFVTVFDL